MRFKVYLGKVRAATTGTEPLTWFGNIRTAMFALNVLDAHLESPLKGCHTNNLHGHTPLVTAASRGHAILVRMLLHYDATARCACRDSALLEAAQRGIVSVLQAIAESKSLTSWPPLTHNEISEALCAAVAAGHSEIVERMLKIFYPANIELKQLTSLYGCAARAGHDAVIRSLARGDVPLTNS